MSLLTTEIPSADVAPATAAPSKISGLLQEHPPSRRGVLRGIVATGMVVAISALDALPTLRRAEAAPPPTRPGGCRGSGPVRPIPATWRVCNPASADVSAGYCASNGYHRTDAKRVSSCETLDYRLDYRCGRIPGTRRNYNAWTWRRGESGGTKRSVRCSDGLVYVLDRCGPDYHYKTACKRYL